MVAAALARRYIVSDGPQGGAGRGRPSRARDDRAADRAPLDVRSASAAASEGNACGQVNTGKARTGGSHLPMSARGWVSLPPAGPRSACLQPLPSAAADHTKR